MTDNALSAAILVGGQSRRMGENKALIRLDPDAPAVIELVVQTLRSITSEIVLVGSDDSAYASLGLPTFPDLTPGIGALGGIHTAVSTTTSPHVLVVACDMPFLNGDLLRYMAAQIRDYDALVPLLDRPQPLHAIYARTCLPHIERSIDVGNYQATGWLAGAEVRYIDRDTIRHFDPNLRSCFNMNTPEDVALARQVVARCRRSEERSHNQGR